MAKIQAGNIDEALYEQIEASAIKHERSMEGEIRIALRDYYVQSTGFGPLSLRMQWQQQTGQRLKWLIDRLIADGWLHRWKREHAVGMPDVVRVALRLEVSPGSLMDLLEGRGEMTPGMVDELAKRLSISSDWLLTGEGLPFNVTRMGSSGYSEFFLPGDGGKYAFELLRIRRGSHEGTLIILRTRADTGHTEFGVVTEAFYLGAGMGSGGYTNLKRFLLFLKTKCGHVEANTYDFIPPEPDFDFWSVIGQHHPIWFQDTSLRSTAGWLQQVYSGEDPGWFKGWSSILEEIAVAPFGGGEQETSSAFEK